MMIQKEELPHILVVDDDKEIRDLLGKFLSQYNFQVALAQDGKEMFTILNDKAIDLIILDVMLPGEDGFGLCRKLRSQYATPIIMLTAVSEDTDRIVGLELGADDYISKPFNPRELLARIKAILRRMQERQQNEKIDTEKLQKHSFSGWVLNEGTRRLTDPNNVEVNLSAGEYELLLAFLYKPRRVLNRDQLMDFTKQREAMPFDRSIDVQISRLRHKIEVDPKEPELIKTVRGGGYMFTSEVKRC